MGNQDLDALTAYTEGLGQRILELESGTSALAGRVRDALAEDPQMIFDAVDLMNARQTGSGPQ